MKTDIISHQGLVYKCTCEEAACPVMDSNMNQKHLFEVTEVPTLWGKTDME